MSREYQRFDMAVSSVRQTLSRDHSMGLARLVAPSAAFWDEADRQSLIYLESTEAADY